MKVIDFNTIAQLGIQPKLCVDWVKDAFLQKYDSILPPKISISQPNNIFFNTMPCYIPNLDVFGVKVVSRFPKRAPALQADIMLYNAIDGELLATMDASWITTMRTGAVTALAIETLKRKNCKEYSFVGLGNTARATLLCLNSIHPNEEIIVNLLAYKEQEQLFINRFIEFSNIKFNVWHNIDDMFSKSEVIISAITAADTILCPDAVYRKGTLIVPIHTRGFQNCDLFFDKIYADDKEHVKDFKNFARFKRFDEISQVLLKNTPGRESDDECIISYNIGIALHDIYFATKIYNLVQKENILLNSLNNKYWV